MPPLNSWQIMPVPPPTLPSATGPSVAPAIASSAMACVTGKLSASESQPSQVSADDRQVEGLLDAAIDGVARRPRRAPPPPHRCW